MATITGVAVGNPDFSILVAALQYVDANVEDTALVATLDDADASLTVFAPTNAAFGDLATDLGYTGDVTDTDAVTNYIVTNVDAETIKSILLYHVAAGTLTSTDVSAAASVTSLQGADIGVDLPTLVDQEPDLIDATLTTLDVAADNGVVHIIDKVLLPINLPDNDAPTITDIVAASGDAFDTDGTDFDVLLQAVVTADLAETLADADADLTVFAPTDQAFIDLATDLGFEGDSEGDAWSFLVETLTTLGEGDPIPLLTSILTYHVSGESLQASQVLAATDITSLEGGAIAVDAAAGTLGDQDADLTDPTLIKTDIQAANGVVHVIDKVLLPLNVPDVMETAEAEAEAEASSGSSDNIIAKIFGAIFDLLDGFFGLLGGGSSSSASAAVAPETTSSEMPDIPTVDASEEDDIEDDTEADDLIAV